MKTESKKEIATCASCGEQRELCNSVRIDGIKQPRICKDCLLSSMILPEEVPFIEEYWIKQIVELNDNESINAFVKRFGKSVNALEKEYGGKL